MKKALCFSWLVVAILVVIGCAYNPPIYNAARDEAGGTIGTANKATLEIPFDEAWQRTIKALYDTGYSIKNSDKSSGIITTDKRTVRLNETQVDCGNIWGIPYAKDTRTTTTVFFSALLQRSVGKTEIIINSQIEGLFNATAVSGTKQLSCVSLGGIEKDLIERVKQSK